MAQTYAKLAADIVKAVGGRENVESIRHCVTRLRFTLKDEKKAQDDTLKRMDGVVTVVKAAGEYMVVIGEHVHQVFVEVCRELGVEPSDGSKITLQQKKMGPLAYVLDIIMSAMGPTLNLLCACGIIKGILAIMGFAGVPTTDGIYMLMNAAGDCFFYFMPLLLAYNIAKKLSIDPVFGFILAAAMCYPDINGVDINLFGHVINATYTGTFLPVVFGVAIAAPLYKLLDKHLPKLVKGFFTPLLTLLVAFPLTFVVVGPVANMIGVGINWLTNTIIGISPIIGGTIMGGIWQILVLFGVHGIPIMFAFMDLMQGNSNQLIAFTASGCFAQIGVVLAIIIKTKNARLRDIALPSFVSGIFGVTEPAIYGVTLPRLKMFVLSCIGAAVGGLTIGLFNLTMYTYAGMGIFGLLGMLNPAGPNFLGVLLAAIVPFVVGLALALAIYRDEDYPEANATLGESELEPVAKPSSPEPAKPIDPTMIKQRIAVSSPMAGEVKPLSACSDEAFSGEAMGKGCLIAPSAGEVVAPCDGTVRVLFPTLHAIGLTTPDGCEIMIHIGMDTVRLEGKHFTAHVSQGDAVTKGQPLVSFDKDAIEAAGYRTETPVIITNTDDYLDVVSLADGTVAAGDDLLVVLN